MQPSLSECVPVSLLVLESGATFPFEAAGYRRAVDTAIVVQQHGESKASLKGRIRRAARQLLLAGVSLTTVALVVDQNSDQRHPERYDTALALLEQLPANDAQLLLIADGARRPLRQDLMTLVGTLIERDHVKHSVAIDFDARTVAEPTAADTPKRVLPARGRSTLKSAHAC